MRRILRVAALAAFATVGDFREADAQAPPRPGSVRVVVRDATDLPVAAAVVSLTAADGSILRATTSQRGEAAFDGLRPGPYKGVIESPGFNQFDLGELTLQPGQRLSRTAVLTIAGFSEELAVAPAADDERLLNAFTTQLTDDQLAALPEDPEELALVLQQLLGDDADIRVDGFSGGRLPPGTQISDIRIRYDQASASSGGGPRVEIRTQPGGDRWRNNASLSVRDEALNARNPFADERPSGQTRQYSWNLNGPLVRGRTGFSLSIDGARAIENQTIHAAAPGGIYANLIEQPSSRLNVWTRVDHSINPAQTIRVDFNRNGDHAHNQGLGEFDLPERAYSREGSTGELRASHHSTIRKRYVNDLRFTYGWSSSESFAKTNGRTIRVLDAFTSGGAQIQGGRFWKEFELEDEVEFTVRKAHQIHAELNVDGTSYHGNELRNSAGTFVFASLSDFNAGLPTSFAQRLGDPGYRYAMTRFSWSIEDNYRVRRDVVLNFELGHQVQTHLRDWDNFGPRVGVNWTPSAAARTTFRASVGAAYSYINADTLLQTVLVNGEQQRDLVISNPGYPDPFGGGTSEAGTPPGIIRARHDLLMPYNLRYTVGVDQPIGRILRFRGTYSHQNGHNLLRSLDANAGIDGVRPDPAVRTITELQTKARSLNESIALDLSLNYPPRRLSGNLNYQYGQALNETDGAFALPPDSLDLSQEWGASRNDLRHRLNASLNTDLPAGFRINTSVRSQSAAPYNITTGVDLNGDGANNERPVGIVRNTGRGSATNNVDFTLTWGWRIGQRVIDGPARPLAGRGAQRAMPAANRNNELFRFEIYARANNVLNAVNAQSFSGVITSPFFGLPTSASAARRVVMGTRIWF
jgi:Carboxypeptidase regulatory-like domain